MMSHNRGTYITTNTLIDLVKTENVIRFDSDDIMTPNLVSEVLKNKKDNDIIMFGSVQMRDDVIDHNNFLMAEGIIYFKKSVMDNIIGGYQPWICAADTELIKRVINKVKIYQFKKALFYRRLHSKSLTHSPKTGYFTEIRKKYKSQIKNNYKDDEVKIERVINSIEEIEIEKNIPISIFITAYKSQDFIEECLDSVEKQSYFIDNNNFEVLVGVDGCKNTLDKLNKIKHKYRNLRIFMMDSNKGTYVTSNTLLNLVNHENIIRFDSDDVMKLYMIKTIIKNLDIEYDIIRFSYDSFINNTNNIIKSKIHYPHGVVLYKKHVFDIVGGYQNWLCAADTELIERVKDKIKIKMLNDRLFLRRQHGDSLTKKVDTKHGSGLRQSYKKLIGNHKSNWIDKKTNTYVEY